MLILYVYGLIKPVQVPFFHPIDGIKFAVKTVFTNAGVILWSTEFVWLQLK